MPANRNYEIKEVAELTGLAPARLRAWERRYKVVRPRRLANRYRVYTSEQVALLRAFARLIAGGERIGELTQEPVESVLSRAEGSVNDGSPLPGMLDALRHFDRERLADLLEEEHRSRPLESFIREVILPLAELIGDQWALGKLSVAVEHLASDVVIAALKRELELNAEGTGHARGLPSGRASRVGLALSPCASRPRRLESPLPRRGLAAA